MIGDAAVVYRTSTLGDAIASPEPDVALLDLGLPDSDGIETITRYRQYHPYVPVVALTGAEVSGDAAIRAGAGACYTKGHLVLSELIGSMEAAAGELCPAKELAGSIADRLEDLRGLLLK